MKTGSLVSRCVGWSFMVMAAGTLCGCAAAGAAGDVAGSAIETTQTLFRAGKADHMSNVPLDRAISAIQSVAEAMDLGFVRKQPHPDQLKLVYVDQRKQEVVVTLIRRTQTVTAIHVDVGFFGEEDLGTLLLREVVARLSPPGAKESTTLP